MAKKRVSKSKKTKRTAVKSAEAPVVEPMPSAEVSRPVSYEPAATAQPSRSGSGVKAFLILLVFIGILVMVFGDNTAGMLIIFLAIIIFGIERLMGRRLTNVI